MVFVSVMATVFALFEGAWNREQAERSSSEVDATLAVAIARFSADVRHVRAVAPPLTGQDPRHVLSLDVTEPDGRQHRIRWRVTGATVMREELDARGGVTASVTMYANVLPSDPTFGYYTTNGIALRPGIASPSELAACTARVSVDLRFDPLFGRREIERRTSIAVPATDRGEVASC
jgi:hypothetical protein